MPSSTEKCLGQGGLMGTAWAAEKRISTILNQFKMTPALDGCLHSLLECNRWLTSSQRVRADHEPLSL